jgi:hypothetical protein
MNNMVFSLHVYNVYKTLLLSNKVYSGLMEFISYQFVKLPFGLSHWCGISWKVKFVPRYLHGMSILQDFIS